MFKKNDESITLTKKNFILILVILVLGVIVSLYLANILSNVTEKKYKKSISISERLASIDDNFNIKVTKVENDETISMSVSCDENICLYQSDSFENKEIVYYNGKNYTLSNFEDTENAKLLELKTSEYDKLFNKKYYDLRLIKGIIEVSTREKDENNNIKASVSLERYLKEYNYIYNEINKTEEDIKISITIVNGLSNIRSITVDYKDIDRYFNKSDFDTLSYKIEIESVNYNDYEYIKEYIDKNIK